VLSYKGYVIYRSIVLLIPDSSGELMSLLLTLSWDLDFMDEPISSPTLHAGSLAALSSPQEPQAHALRPLEFSPIEVRS